MPPSPRTLRTVGCLTFYEGHSLMEQEFTPKPSSVFFDELTWRDVDTGVRKVSKPGCTLHMLSNADDSL